MDGEKKSQLLPPSNIHLLSHNKNAGNECCSLVHFGISSTSLTRKMSLCLLMWLIQSLTISSFVGMRGAGSDDGTILLVVFDPKTLLRNGEAIVKQQIDKIQKTVEKRS